MSLWMEGVTFNTPTKTKYSPRKMDRVLRTMEPILWGLLLTLSGQKEGKRRELDRSRNRGVRGKRQQRFAFPAAHTHGGGSGCGDDPSDWLSHVLCVCPRPRRTVTAVAMVTFTCSSCGDSVRKNAVERHAFKCRFNVLTCIDCFKEFTYVAVAHEVAHLTGSPIFDPAGGPHLSRIISA